MRFAWIDGVYVEVDCCGHCPFFSTEYELGGTCQYPKSSVGSFDCFVADEGVRDDCPLRSTEGS